MNQSLASNTAELNERFDDAVLGLQYLNGKTLPISEPVKPWWNFWSSPKPSYDFDTALTNFDNSATPEARRARAKLAQVEGWLAAYSKMIEPSGFLFGHARGSQLKTIKEPTIQSWTRPIARKDPRFKDFLHYRCETRGRKNACRAFDLIREAEELNE